MPPTEKEIREAYKDYRSDWKVNYDEGDQDLKAICGDPWDEADRDARKQAGRPCLALDELNQYLNQYVANLRELNLAIQVTPEGDGANDENAKARAAVIRGIEYKSNAEGANITAGENAASRGYGFSLIRTEYDDKSSFNQSIKIQRVANPNMILLNPSYKEADASDVSDAFVLDLITKEKFKQKYPKAQVTSFTGEIMGESGVSDWIREKMIQEGEYWKVESDYETLLMVRTPAGVVPMSEDDFERMGKHGEVIRSRRVEIPRVMQYMTNGVEILDEVEWAGSRIPIISCFGKEVFVNEGSGAKRRLISMVRLARDPQMLFNYLATQECELAGMIPKTPWVGYKGQFESDKEAWTNSNKIPTAFLQADAVMDIGGSSPLPIPQRPQWDAPFQEFEVAKDSARRSIQAAMGITPLPTAAQRNNEKSGIALDKIQHQEQVGTFQFTSNYRRYMHNLGWQVNELIKPIIDTQRDQPVVNADGTYGTMQTVGNTSHPVEEGQYQVIGLEEEHLHTGIGNFGITIDDGPSFQSERQAQGDFVDHFLETMPSLPQPGTPGAKVVAMAIRMKADLGVIGDQIADVYDPPDPSGFPPGAQAAISNLQAQLQQTMQENQALHLDRAGRVLEQQTKKEIEGMKAQNAQIVQNQNNLAKIVIAELNKQSRSTDQIAEFDASRLEQALGMAHDTALTAMEHQHAKELSAQGHQQGLQQADQANQNASAQSAQQGQQAKDLASHQQAIAPPESASSSGT